MHISGKFVPTIVTQTDGKVWVAPTYDNMDKADQMPYGPYSSRDEAIIAAREIHASTTCSECVTVSSKSSSPLYISTDGSDRQFYTSTDDSDPLFYAPKEWNDGAQHAAGWYFYNETWSYTHGPFSDYPTARSALKMYANRL